MKRGGLYFIIDDSDSFCGITDRLKTAVGLYWVALQNGVGFKFIHTAGFDIRDYLVPNKVEWSAELSDITKLPWKKKKLDYIPPFNGVPSLKKNKTYICKRYIGKNIIEMLDVPEWQKVWRGLFNDLFAPSELVRKTVEDYDLPERYAVVNARFINSLEQSENVDYNSPLPPEERRRLIDSVLEKVALCQAGSEVPVIVYSDSETFLKAVSENGFRICDPTGTGNIMNQGVSDMVKLMTFVNFFHMARAEKIYSILNVEGFPANCLYKTQYPRYAAILGDKPFVRI